jgi:hypothetical protein
MDRLRAVVPLARWLFALAERERDVLVRVKSHGRCAELSLVRGKLCALHGIDVGTLGDDLLRRGALDRSLHGAALERNPPHGPIGRWLIDAGVAPQALVQEALEAQLSARLRTLLAWPELSLEVCPTTNTHVASDVRIDLPAALWSALLALAAELSPLARERASGQRALSLSPFGRRLAQQLSRASVELDVPRIVIANPAPAVSNQRVLFRVLGAVSEHSIADASYSLLLRKQREIRRRESAATLLDLREPVRPGEARRAFRKLAFQLHPDRFQVGAPELCTVSAEVMRALSLAEEQLRHVRRVG